MKTNVILLIDTFFYVAVWKGQQIKDWEKAGYAENPDYANFKALLEAPVEDATYIMQERFPMPRFYITHPGDTSERRLKVKLNPSSLDPTKNTSVESGHFHTEDVSLQVFMQHLIKMAVQS